MRVRSRTFRLLIVAVVAAMIGVVAIVARRLYWPAQLADVPFVDPDTTAPPLTQYKLFRSETIRGDASYVIYLPPGYDGSGTSRCPVIYWLHGLGGKPSDGDDFVELLDAAIRRGDTPPTIAVMVNGLEYSRYYDSKDGRLPVETVFIRDLIPHVDATYRTIAKREGRAIEGFSMGGFGAIRLAFRYPELFCATTSLSGAFRSERGIRGGLGGSESWSRAHFQKIFGGDTEYYRVTTPQVLAVENADRLRASLKIRLFAGALDGQGGATDRLHQQLDELAIPHEYARVPGVGHVHRKMYETLGPKHFTFYRDLFGTTP